MALRSAPRAAVALLAALTLSLLAAPVADAQYFGRNQVRYTNFQFQVMQTEHFDLYFYPEKEQAARDVARMAERWYQRLSTIFEHEFTERKTIILYADDADFRQTNLVPIGEGTQGVTEGLRQRVALAMRPTYADTDHVLGHELVHQFQFDMAQRAGRFANFVRLPLFVVEGMAEYFSLGRTDALTAMWMRDAVLRDDFPTFSELQRNPRFNEYRYGQPFWAYLAGTYGDEASVRFFRNALEMPLDSALVSVTGLSPDSLSARWAASLRATLVPPAEGRQVPRPELAEAPARPRRGTAFPDTLASLSGERLLARERRTGSINIAPQLSPDGEFVAFFSERDLFGIDLFLADANTGTVLRRLESAGTNAHFDALSFLESAGAWSPDGRLFAYVVFSGGSNEIALLDVNTRRVQRRIAVRDVGAIKDPAFSPDGRQIVFSGMRGGISDLYLVDVVGGSVRQLTNDRYADFQPSFSPDGRFIAFATDRGPGTDFERLTFAEPRIALYDLETNEIEVLSLFANAKHINPVFSPDGESLYFIADRSGFSDIYRLERATGQLFQVTRLATGVSGIAALSPAFSVARNTGELAYAVFEAQRYSVYRASAEEAQGTPILPSLARSNVLPPVDALGRSRVERLLADAEGGLPATRAFPVRPHRSRLSLDYVSQPSVGAIYDPYYGSGLGIAGGISLFFSDQLSDNVLGVAVAANGTLKDIGGQALYINRGRRLNYGGQVGHVPYLQRFSGFAPPDEQGRSYPTIYNYRVFVTQVGGLAAYPFNQTQRLEGQIGYRRYGYDLEFLLAEDLTGDGRLDGYTRFVSAPDGFFNTQALNLGEAGAAFVGDYSFFGFTSPIRGGRYRFGVDGTVGTLNFAAATADYRRYFFTRPPGFPDRLPVTLAFRALHYGRYGPDAESGRLQPLYLGFGSLVRGYTYGSFASDAAYTAFEDRLFGSRMLLGNAELRLPLLGVPQLGLLSFPFLPTELTLFADAGMAWGTIQNVRFGLPDGSQGSIPIGRSFQEQRPIYSAGVSARINVLGALILEPYYAFPFSRTDRQAVFGLNLTPGW